MRIFPANFQKIEAAEKAEMVFPCRLAFKQRRLILLIETDQGDNVIERDDLRQVYIIEFLPGERDLLESFNWIDWHSIQIEDRIFLSWSKEERRKERNKRKRRNKGVR